MIAFVLLQLAATFAPSYVPQYTVTAVTGADPVDIRLPFRDAATEVTLVAARLEIDGMSI